MSESNAIPLIILLSVVLIAGALIVSYFVGQGRRKAWSDFAERIGANYDSGGSWFGRPTVTGVYQHHQFKLDSFTRRSGKSSTTYTRITVYLNNRTPFTLTIYQEGLFSKIGKAMGMKDIQIGDEEIDQRYVIKGEPETEVLRVLSSLGMRQRLLEAPYLHIDIKDGVELYEKRGFEIDPNVLIAVLDLMNAIADAADRL
jgi:hypothetical protein